MSSERQIRIVEQHVDAFRDAGATIETGGRRADTPVRMSVASTRKRAGDADASTGNETIPGGTGDADRSVRAPLFYEPTVITGATNDMLPMREETFGPTLPIATFRTEEEAVALANDTEFGLTASVWTRDRARARRVAERIEAGTVCINEVLYTHGIGQTPWGGFKNSGRGRTHGLEGLMELVQPQHIHTNHVPLLPNPWWMPYSPLAVKTFRAFATKFASGSYAKISQLTPLLAKRARELYKFSRR